MVPMAEARDKAYRSCAPNGMLTLSRSMQLLSLSDLENGNVE